MRTLNTQLSDRTLRFDGVSEIQPDEVARYLLLGVPASKLRVTELDSDIEKFNFQVAPEDQVSPVSNEPIELNMDWSIPEPWLSLDLDTYIMDQYFERIWPQHDADMEKKAIQRIADELEQVRARGMVEFMRTVIYILHVLRQKNVVWGVGRGSSCASYLLFIIGLHVVDCVAFDVPMEEFFHE